VSRALAPALAPPDGGHLPACLTAHATLRVQHATAAWLTVRSAALLAHLARDTDGHTARAMATGLAFDLRRALKAQGAALRLPVYDTAPSLAALPSRLLHTADPVWQPRDVGAAFDAAMARRTIVPPSWLARLLLNLALVVTCPDKLQPAAAAAAAASNSGTACVTPVIAVFFMVSTAALRGARCAIVAECRDGGRPHRRARGGARARGGGGVERGGAGGAGRLGPLDEPAVARVGIALAPVHALALWLSTHAACLAPAAPCTAVTSGVSAPRCPDCALRGRFWDAVASLANLLSTRICPRLPAPPSPPFSLTAGAALGAVPWLSEELLAAATGCTRGAVLAGYETRAGGGASAASLFGTTSDSSADAAGGGGGGGGGGGAQEDATSVCAALPPAAWSPLVVAAAAAEGAASSGRWDASPDTCPLLYSPARLLTRPQAPGTASAVAAAGVRAAAVLRIVYALAAARAGALWLSDVSTIRSRPRSSATGGVEGGACDSASSGASDSSSGSSGRRQPPHAKRARTRTNDDEHN